MRRGGRAHEIHPHADPDDVLYDFRTMVERINGRFKDEFGGGFVRVRGAVKVKCQLMFGILASPSIKNSASDPSSGTRLTFDHSEPIGTKKSRVQ